MKITFIGTGHGYPDVGRQCSGTMLEINGYYYFIDAGADLAQYIVDSGIDRSKLRALFVTHRHGDHLWGAFRLLCCLNEFTAEWGNTKMDFVMPEKSAIRLCQSILLEDAMSVNQERIQFLNLKKSPFYEDENIKLTAVPTDHASVNLQAWAFIIEAEGKKLIFTGDMHTRLHDFPAAALGDETFDFILCEYAHSRAEFVEPLLPKINTKKLYFNHLGRGKEERIAEIEAWNKQYPNTEMRAVVTDGEQIEL